MDEDLADNAVAYIRKHHSVSPQRPFFTYYCTGTAHAPHHAPKEWIEKYKGKFDQGWDKVREETYERQKKSGVIPPNTKLTARNQNVPCGIILPPIRKNCMHTKWKYMQVHCPMLIIILAG